MSRFILCGLILLSLASNAVAKQRIALVIGNANYSKGYLKNPINDAEDIAAILKDIGFDDVTLIKNGTRRTMLKAVQNFRAKLSTNTGVAFLFYAGHGAQFDGDSYLLPLQSSIVSTADLPIEALRAKDILTQMRSSGSRVNVMVLDACRNLPYPALKRSGERGLARIDAIGRALIAYSTSPGNTAADGSGRNSPYTRALKKLLPQKNLTLTQLFNDVGVMVDENSGGKQTPWVSSSPMPRVYLAGLNQNTNTQNNAIIDTPVVPSHKSYEPEMVSIRGGTFTMGSPVNEKGRQNDEKPHRVTVKDFWIGKTEVTFAQWDACVAGGGCQSSKYPDDEGWGRGNRPVINVSWHEANEYTRWLSQKTGKEYRLPTEAEWEYAARGGTKTAFSYGSSYKQLCQYANHADQSVDYSWTNKQCNDGVGKKTARVKRYKANRYGLYDMHGNVYEWTCSAYDKNYGGSEQQCVNRNDNRSRVLRGGSWGSRPRSLRSANRDDYTATNRYFGVGFRISRTF